VDKSAPFYIYKEEEMPQSRVDAEWLVPRSAFFVPDFDFYVPILS
jgi:hypothetical protein